MTGGREVLDWDVPARYSIMAEPIDDHEAEKLLDEDLSYPLEKAQKRRTGVAYVLWWISYLFLLVVAVYSAVQLHWERRRHHSPELAGDLTGNAPSRALL